MIQIWRLIKTNEVIKQLHKSLMLVGQHDDHHHHVIKNRDRIYKKIDAMLIRASLTHFKNHDAIINEGGIEVLLELLKIFRADEGIVDIIFRLLVTLLHEDNKYRDNVGHYRQHRTATRMHLIGDEGIIGESTKIYEQNEQIRILGKSILKDLFIAENFAAMKSLRQVQEAVKYSIPFALYAEINKQIIIPKKFMKVNKSCEADVDNSHGRRDIPGELGIEIVQSNMLLFPDSDSVQLIGLDIILTCLEHNNRNVAYSFIDEKCVQILLHAITIQKFEIRWRAYVTLMKLTTSKVFCKHFETMQGCKVLLNELQQWFEHGEEMHYSILQLSLWSLSNLFKCENCLRIFVQLGLKPLLIKIVEYSGNNHVILPLDIQYLLSRSDLNDDSLFEVTEILSPPQIEDDIYHDSHKVSHSNTKLKSLLPPPKDAKPSHGTTADLFEGQSGLI